MERPPAPLVTVRETGCTVGAAEFCADIMDASAALGSAMLAKERPNLRDSLDMRTRELEKRWGACLS